MMNAIRANKQSKAAQKLLLYLGFTIKQWRSVFLQEQPANLGTTSVP